MDPILRKLPHSSNMLIRQHVDLSSNHNQGMTDASVFNLHLVDETFYQLLRHTWG